MNPRNFAVAVAVFAMALLAGCGGDSAKKDFDPYDQSARERVESYVKGASNLLGDSSQATCDFGNDLGHNHYEYDCKTEISSDGELWLPYQQITVNWDGQDGTGEATDACNWPLMASQPDAPDARTC